MLSKNLCHYSIACEFLFSNCDENLRYYLIALGDVSSISSRHTIVKSSNIIEQFTH
jgi:hypothetical protein